MKYVYLALSVSFAAAPLTESDETGPVYAHADPVISGSGIPTAPVRLWPWLEVNTLAAWREDQAVEGLLAWQKATDTAIISTRPGCAPLYANLRRRVPGMHIIPGLKTSKLLPRFDSVEGWKAVASEALLLCDAANEKRLVLEHEGALRGYWSGDYEIDPDRLRRALALLPHDIEYIWYPGFVGEKEELRRRQELVCRIANETIAVRFTDITYGSPADVKYRKRPHMQKRLAEIEKLVTLPLIPMLYCLRHERRGEIYWPMKDVLQTASQTQQQEVIVYPGAKRWTRCAEIIAGQLAQRGAGDRP
ncbi:MAG: hypothetical protein ACE5HE_03475 [Phycisphaerae bacterium]